MDSALSRWYLSHKQTLELALLAPQMAAQSGPGLSMQACDGCSVIMSTRTCGGPDVIWGTMQAEPLLGQTKESLGGRD